MCKPASSDVPPETPSTSQAAAGQVEETQSSSQGESSAEANTASAGTASHSTPQL